MRKRTYLKMATNILIHSKLRSWLTIIGIVIGVAAVVSIISLGDSMEQDIQSRLNDMDLTTISISPGYTRAQSMMGPPGGGGSSTADDTEITDKDIDAIKNIDGILYISGQISGQEDINYAGETASLSITGVDPQVWQYMTTSELESGRMLETADKNVAVIGSSLATDVFSREIGLNQIISINGKSIRVVGILASEGGRSDNGIIMPLDGAVEVIEDAEEDVFDSISIKVESTDVVDSVTEEIEEKLMISRQIHNEDDRDFSVTSSMSMADSVSEMTESMTLFLSAIAAVSLLVGAVGIANTMFTSVLERTKEIGTMKAIGAKNHDIMMIFIVNSALVGLVGGLLGVACGALATSLFPMLGVTLMGGSASIVLSPTLMLSGLAIAVVIGIVSGAVPAYRASKLKPVDALRYE
ncbi:putative ABC transport system permease protein [Methanohalophilus levihalophilus]|uniref:ABC transporter permease n=1 Tax=Methanohalophilus levihalophilus TaxID=1431282 RepID=UPI001AE5F82E|nr:ABC transporter permease [Methanohalophilus levihalophilus]MBP2029084.1 putative ABC transport system permease protein [Methanohalophilus levihalophilus]